MSSCRIVTRLVVCFVSGPDRIFLCLVVASFPRRCGKWLWTVIGGTSAAFDKAVWCLGTVCMRMSNAPWSRLPKPVASMWLFQCCFLWCSVRWSRWCRLFSSSHETNHAARVRVSCSPGVAACCCRLCLLWGVITCCVSGGHCSPRPYCVASGIHPQQPQHLHLASIAHGVGGDCVGARLSCLGLHRRSGGGVPP